MEAVIGDRQFAENLALELELGMNETYLLLSDACERLDQASDGDEYTDDDIARVARELYFDPDNDGI